MRLCMCVMYVSWRDVCIGVGDVLICVWACQEWMCSLRLLFLRKSLPLWLKYKEVCLVYAGCVCTGIYI